MNTPPGITVKISNKEYQVNCPKGNESELFDAAQYLDLKMREIRNTGKVIGTERIAIMAALNIAHELLSHKTEIINNEQAFVERLYYLQKKISGALIKNEKPKTQTVLDNTY